MENETMFKEIMNAFRMYSEKVDAKFDEIREEIAGVKKELADGKREMTSVKGDLSSVKNDLTNVKSDLTNVKSDLASVKSEMKEGFTKVNSRLDLLTERQEREQADLIETKETVHFLHSKVVQHEKKLHKLSLEQ